MSFFEKTCEMRLRKCFYPSVSHSCSSSNVPSHYFTDLDYEQFASLGKNNGSKLNSIAIKRDFFLSFCYQGNQSLECNWRRNILLNYFRLVRLYLWKTEEYMYVVDKREKKSSNPKVDYLISFGKPGSGLSLECFRIESGVFFMILSY